MLNLRFISPYKVNKSPIQLSYQPDTSSNALLMRFNKAYTVNVSPITIRFGDDTGPVDPTLPILQANIGIEVDSNFRLDPFPNCIAPIDIEYNLPYCSNHNILPISNLHLHHFVDGHNGLQPVELPVQF